MCSTRSARIDWTSLPRLSSSPTRVERGLYQITHQGQDQLLDCLSELDVVFPVLHGPYGEDGTVQGLLEMADLAYVGAGVVGSAVGMDKGIFKDVMRSHDIPVVDWMIVSRAQDRAGH